MLFSNPILGGAGALVRQSIHSPDYVAGVSGWTINKDGFAEFNDVTLRGDLHIVGDDGSEVWIREKNNAAVVQLYPPNLPATGDPANLVGYNNGSLPELLMLGPNTNSGLAADIHLRTDGGDPVAEIHANAIGIGPFSLSSPYRTGSYLSVFPEDVYFLTERFNPGRILASRFNGGNTGAYAGLKDGQFYEENGNAIAVTTQSFYDDANVNTTSTSFVADPGSATAGLVFYRPASGKVLVEWASLISNTGANYVLVGWEIRQGSTVGSGTVSFAATDGRTIEHTGTSPATACSFFEATLPGNSTSVFNIRLMYRTGAGTMTSARRRLRVSPVLY